MTLLKRCKREEKFAPYPFLLTSVDGSDPLKDSVASFAVLAVRVRDGKKVQRNAENGFETEVPEPSGT